MERFSLSAHRLSGLPSPIIGIENPRGLVTSSLSLQIKKTWYPNKLSPGYLIVAPNRGADEGPMRLSHEAGSRLTRKPHHWNFTTSLLIWVEWRPIRSSYSRYASRPRGHGDLRLARVQRSRPRNQAGSQDSHELGLLTLLSHARRKRQP